MKQRANDDGFAFKMRTDFDAAEISEREREVLRTILPQLMLELIQSGSSDNDERE